MADAVALKLTRADILAAAASIGAEPAALKAVADVEAGGSGFLAGGRPKILFEGHVFWRQIKKRGIDPRPIAAKHPTICYEKWTREHYYGGKREYIRLQQARAVHEDAALESASWGLFQLMGMNFRAAGFDTIQDFLAAHKQGEGEHLNAIVRWMKSNGLAKRLKAKDWKGFAAGYNGPAYEKNAYHLKLQTAYEKAVAAGWNG